MEVTYSNAMRHAFGAAVLSVIDKQATPRITPLQRSVVKAISGGRGLVRRKTMWSATRDR